MVHGSWLRVKGSWLRVLCEQSGKAERMVIINRSCEIDRSSCSFYIIYPYYYTLQADHKKTTYVRGPTKQAYLVHEASINASRTIGYFLGAVVFALI